MAFILKYLIRHKIYVIMISVAVIVLSAVVAFYETGRRNMVRANNEMIDLHHNEVYMLSHEISIRDINIAEMATQNNALHVENAAMHGEITYAHSNRHIAENSLNDLQQQFDDLQSRYWRNHMLAWDMGLLEMDAPIITHVATDSGKIDMLVRHFNAMYAGDLDTYLATLIDGEYWEHPGIDPESGEWRDRDGGRTWTDFLLLTFRDIAGREYYRAELRLVPDWWWSHNSEWERQTSGHLLVRVLVQETPDSEPFLRFHSVSVTSSGGPN